MPQSTKVEKKLKCAEGRNVPMEDGRDWPEGGIIVPVTHYIRRRIADGDLVEVESKGSTAPSVPAPETVNDEKVSKTKTGDK